MSVISLLLVAILLAIAALHTAWGLGVCWPISDEAHLAKSVVGAKGITRMPPKWASIMVAGALICSAFLVLAAGGFLELPIPNWLVTLSVWAMVVIFGARGLASYLPAWRGVLEPSFDRLNTRYYGPLCLLIAAGTWTQL